MDPSTSVRVAYAYNIATLAEIALRYLEQTQNDLSDGKMKPISLHGKDAIRINYEIELQTLHEMVQQTVSALLTDSQTIVKQTLMESGITKLCVFFGKQKGKLFSLCLYNYMLRNEATTPPPSTYNIIIITMNTSRGQVTVNCLEPGSATADTR